MYQSRPCVKIGSVAMYLVFQRIHKVKDCRGVKWIRCIEKVMEKAGKFQPFPLLVSQSIGFYEV
jgi:hypothetical protein